MEAGEKVAEYMLRQNGHFYVCGSARQVPEDLSGPGMGRGIGGF